jgi:hypothetical protein
MWWVGTRIIPLPFQRYPWLLHARADLSTLASGTMWGGPSYKIVREPSASKMPAGSVTSWLIYRYLRSVSSVSGSRTSTHPGAGPRRPYETLSAGKPSGHQHHHHRHRCSCRHPPPSNGGVHMKPYTLNPQPRTPPLPITLNTYPLPSEPKRWRSQLAWVDPAVESSDCSGVFLLFSNSPTPKQMPYHGKDVVEYRWFFFRTISYRNMFTRGRGTSHFT